MDDELPCTSKTTRRSSAASPSVFSLADKCLFCDKEAIKVKGVKSSLITCKTEIAEASIKSAASEKGDEEILRKVRDQDLRAREARYHELCRRNYTRSITRHVSHADTESAQSQAAHNDAFEFICGYIQENILVEGKVERLSMIRERYLSLSFLLQKHLRFHNEKYKTYKLKDKLCKHFGEKLSFWKPRKKAELVYAADIEGEAVEAAFELAASDERRLIETAMIIKQIINESRLESEPVPWPRLQLGCFLEQDGLQTCY